MKIYSLLITVSIVFLLNCTTGSYPPNYSKKYVNREPNYEKAYDMELEGIDLTKKNRNKEAVKVLTKAIKKFGDYNHIYRLYTARGICYHKLGMYNKAKKDYYAAVKIYPYYINAWVSLGILYKNSGEIKLAKKVFLKCIEIMPDKKQTFVLLIRNLETFSKAYTASGGLIFEYNFLNINFLLYAAANMSVKTTDNPYQPYIINFKEFAGETNYYMFIMDFSKNPKFRFLPYEKRVRKWVEYEKNQLVRSKKKNIELSKIVLKRVYNRKCALVKIKGDEKQYLLLFFFVKKHGIMLMLKSTKENFDKKTKLMFLLVKNIKVRKIN